MYQDFPSCTQILVPSPSCSGSGNLKILEWTFRDEVGFRVASLPRRRLPFEADGASQASQLLPNSLLQRFLLIQRYCRVATAGLSMLASPCPLSFALCLRCLHAVGTGVGVVHAGGSLSPLVPFHLGSVGAVKAVIFSACLSLSLFR